MLKGFGSKETILECKEENFHFIFMHGILIAQTIFIKIIALRKDEELESAWKSWFDVCELPRTCEENFTMRRSLDKDGGI